MGKSNKLLVEILSEEIPACMQADASRQLQKKFTDKLKELWPDVATNIGVATYISPQRMVLIANNIPESAKTFTEARGPRVGANQSAVDGFLKKYHVTQRVVPEPRLNNAMSAERRGRQQDLEMGTGITEKDGFYFFSSSQTLNAADALAKAIEEILQNFSWPKSMKWNDYAITWVRPIHSILSLLDDQVVNLSFGHIRSGRQTRGHRFMANHSITIEHADHYLKAMEEAFVAIDQYERERAILLQLTDRLNELKQLSELSSNEQSDLNIGELSLIEDQNLLDEVVGLIEYPRVFIGKIEQKFMELPKEVLITSLKVHQKYLMLQHILNQSEDLYGAAHHSPISTIPMVSLAPYFVITANIEPKDGGQALIAGNEKVLKARLSDAMFFMQQDMLSSLDKMSDKLHRVAFHSQIGSLFEKVERMKILSGYIAEAVDRGVSDLGQYDSKRLSLKQLAVRAASLCKSDIVSEMVKEFPELQGIMGYYYALAQKEDEQVAIAIRDHYKPVGPSDPIPANLVGAIVALADKIDTIQQMFAINIRPTGSKDPYALRRSALGIIRIICGYKLHISLRSLLAHGQSSEGKPILKQTITNQDVLQFIRDRLDNFTDQTYDLTFIQNAL